MNCAISLIRPSQPPRSCTMRMCNGLPPNAGCTIALFPARMHGFVKTRPRGGGVTHCPSPALPQSPYPGFPAIPSRLMPSSQWQYGEVYFVVAYRGCAVERIELLGFSPRTPTRLRAERTCGKLIAIHSRDRPCVVTLVVPVLQKSVVLS